MSAKGINRFEDVINELYRRVLLLEFHDILPGSSIKRVYEESKIEYENAVENLKNDISDLNKLKIINLLDDTKITAGSKDGIILTTDSDNILHDLYDNMELLEESLESLLGKKVKVCILLDELWNKKRIIYVEKIKNKEKIDIIDEEDILNKIKSLNTGEKSEFDDLLEIGGE